MTAPIVLILAAATAAANPGAGDAPTLIRDVRVFDGESVLPANSVLIREGKVAAIGRGLAAPEGATVVEGKGKTLLPGLIDAHAHAYGTALRDAVVLGVTFSPGGRSDDARQSLGKNGAALLGQGRRSHLPGHAVLAGPRTPSLRA